MAEAGIYDPYTTVHPLFRAMPTWLSGQDQRRISSYMTYEQIYWNVPDAFKLVQRGDDSLPIYIPSGRQIVDTLNRFVANKMTFGLDPDLGTDAEQTAAMQFITSLMRRERFYSRFNAAKRFGIIRGDWMFHIYADPERNDGKRISIMTVDPGSYFPIYNDENIDEVIGCHIVDQYVTNGGDEVIRRLTYRKETEQGGPSPILMSDQLFEVDEWGQPGTEMGEKVVRDGDFEERVDIRLPDPIQSLPVYHIRNFTEPNNPFGSSELRGMERLIAAINQSITDEELTLALDGLGVYKTTSGPPTNENGEELPWILGPGKVVEIDDEAEFERVTGVGSVMPFQDHLEYLHEQLDRGSGTPSIARGEVDVQVAESGVALAIKMDPMLARAEERDTEITDVLRNMMWDLKAWVTAYEPAFRTGMDPEQGVAILPQYGEKLPVNRKQRFGEIISLVREKVVSRKWAAERLQELGFEIGNFDDMMNEILEEQIAIGQVDADVTGARVDLELGDQQGAGAADELEDV